MLEVKTSGPLFERDLGPALLLANITASNQAGPILGQRLREAYSGGIVHRGPGRFGHLADTVRWATQVSGDVVATRVGPQGRAAFKAWFLEQGTRGPHRGGASGILLPRAARDRRARQTGHAAALKIGPLFRRSAHPHGAPAFHVAERVRAEAWPLLEPIFDREIAKAVGG